MSIDRAQYPELFGDVQRAGLFGSHVDPQQVMRNVMRQGGIAYSASNPVTQYLMRMAPALMQAFYLTQAQAGALPGGGLPDDATGVMDFFTRGLGQGRTMISGALQSLPDVIRSIRNEGAPAEGDLEPLTNAYRQVLRRQFANPENIADLFTTLQSPFMSAKNAQLAEQGRAMQIGDLYGEAAGQAQDWVDYLFGAKPAPKPFDLAPGPAAPGAMPALPAPTAGGIPMWERDVPNAESYRPLPPGVPAAPWGGAGRLGQELGPAITNEDRQMLDEMMLTPEEQRARKRLQLKPGLSATVRG